MIVDMSDLFNNQNFNSISFEPNFGSAEEFSLLDTSSGEITIEPSIDETGSYQLSLTMVEGGQ